MNELIVRSGGLSTTVQDAGRHGQYAIGMPPSGALDLYSYEIANVLVGNPRGAAVLEATYLGPELEFTDARHVAVTGADCEVVINGQPAPTWQPLRVEAGDVLAVPRVRRGARPYLAVAGGIDVPPYLGSRSTYMLTGIGGFHGRALNSGDRLPLGAAAPAAVPSAELPGELRPDFPEVTELRFIVGLCAYRLTTDALRSFLDTEWRVTKDADRVGYRLRGGSLEFVEREQPFGAGSDPANVVDLGYPVGSVQVPGGDEPIVLLNDAVTGGGYATIGTVISADRDLVAQTRTGSRVRFTAVDLDAAMAARQERRARLAKARVALDADPS
ncbi:biotin-dependent carboxyltransferase [Saccharopolyspora hirsuta]|uniref:Biotin-dependent carboxyltransferase n=1 Tax=Saccharopolyspora hirsuta TaxID=1837 RepID=A0A5M7BTV6_SACHI|nr:biotin-dependent carboxyltransferase family protein [Saccharopolyspora hirsuta]KAA5830664.1 biotin-dependent carboxyltransferase [Saccharopolyspora hirsuta]